MKLNEPKVSVVFTLRVPLGLMEQIDDDMEASGDYNSRSQWFQAAAREYLVSRNATRADKAKFKSQKD